MKKSVLIYIAVFCTAMSTKAQDVITLKDGTDIHAFVQDIGEIEVKYKKIENPNGPNYTLKKSEILLIRYENGSKDIFAEEEKPVEKKEIITSEPVKPKSTNSNKTELLPAKSQSRRDVIVRLNRGFGKRGIQAEIFKEDNFAIGYKTYTKSGLPYYGAIRKKKVAYILSFNDSAKKELYPARMSIQDFQSLPIYLDKKNDWVVFGTNSSSNFAYVEKDYPNICKDFNTGKNQCKTAAILSAVSIFFWPAFINPIWYGFFIPSTILSNRGSANICNSITNYYTFCVNYEVLDKYGIIIIPYQKNPLADHIR